MTRNRGAIKASNISTIKFCQPSFFMPYAGFFTEAAERDAYIKARNIKNSVEGYESICASNGASLLNVNQEQVFTFKGSELMTRRQDDTKKMDSSSLGVISKHNDNEIDRMLTDIVIKYFDNCDYKDDLLLDLRPVDDDFNSESIGFRLDFSSSCYSKFDCNAVGENIEKQAADHGLRYLQIKVRRAELLDVVMNGKPWEDLSIGFQCRIYRNPNVYNSDFWFYFTNVYIGNNVALS